MAITDRAIDDRPGLQWALVLSISVIGLVLRLWHIGFELPNIYTGFEQHEVLRAIRLGAGDFDFDRMGKGGLFYLLFIEYGVYFLILRTTGAIHSASDFAIRFLSEPSPFWLIGRVTTAVIATATIPVSYLLGRTVFNWRVGILAALFLALNPIHIKSSHYVNVDIPMVMLGVSAVYAMVRLLESGQTRHYGVAGLLVGLSMMNKLPGGLFTVPLLAAHGLRAWQEGKSTRNWFDRRILLGLFTVGAVYAIGNPGVIVRFPLFLRLLAGVALPGSSSGNVAAEFFSGQTPNRWLFYVVEMYASLGIPLFVIVLLGLVRSLQKPAPGEVLVVLSCVTVYVAVSLSAFVHWRDRYIMPTLPFALILGARLIDEAAGVLKRRGYSGTWALAALVLIAGLPAGYRGLVQASKFARPDTRTLAKSWIEENVPAGATILLDGDPVLSTRLVVPLRNLPENMLARAEELRHTDPGKAAYLRMKAEAQTGKAYDLVPVQTRRTYWKPLQAYREQGIEYLILSAREFDEDEEIKYKKEVHENRKRFYYELRTDPAVIMLKRFDPAELNANGPPLEIYRING